jgi:hypothetical protein
MKRIMSWGAFESFYIIESNKPKWTDTYDMHMLDCIPLTPTIVKLIFGGKRSFAFHISDIDHNDDIMALEGTKKPLSCFTYYKDIENTKITPHTKGGVIYLLEGDLLFSLNKDAMSKPDESGRRWVLMHNFPNNFQNEYWEWRNKNDRPFKEDENEWTAYLRKYLPFIEGLVKKHAEEIRRFCNLYYKDSDEKEDDYNELVLNNIKVKGVLLDKDVVLGYDSEMSLYDDGQDFGDTRLKEIIEDWKKKSIKVVVADNKDEVVKWFHENGGISDYEKFIKGKERYGDKFW